MECETELPDQGVARRLLTELITGRPESEMAQHNSVMPEHNPGMSDHVSGSHPEVAENHPAAPEAGNHMPQPTHVVEEEEEEERQGEEKGTEGVTSTVLPLLRALWYDEESKDVTIVSSDYGRVRCHASILRLISPFASGLLCPYDTMTSEPVWINVPDVPCTAVVEFLKRIYCVEESNIISSPYIAYLVECFHIKPVAPSDFELENECQHISETGFVRLKRDPKAFTTPSVENRPHYYPPPMVSKKRRLVQEKWNGRRMVCTAPVPDVKTVQELEFMGKAYLQGHGSQHGIPKARQMILEDLANALWKHYEVAHANDAVENQNYIVDDGTDDIPVPDHEPRDRHHPAATRDATDFMVSNLVVKAEVQDYSYEDNGGFGDLGDFETDVKEEDYFDNDQDDGGGVDDDADYQPPTKRKKKKKGGGGGSSKDETKPLKTRQKIVHAKKECHLCPHRPFPTFANLRVHMDDAHPDVKDFSCAVCGKSFTTEFDLEKHKMYKHDKKRKYPCPQCDAAFPEPYKLNRHIKSVHDAELEHQCEQCSTGFMTSAQLIRHKHRSHGEPYPDDYKDKLKEEEEAAAVSAGAEGQPDIKAENASDEEDRPVAAGRLPLPKFLPFKKEKMVFSKECHLCQRVFSNQQKLRNHVERIHEVRDFHCGVCSMDFVTAFDLHKHKINEHDKKRRFRCEKCPQAFTETYKLKRHVKTVHDMNRADRGLNCDECESSFAKMAHLIRHKTSIHNTKPENAGAAAGSGSGQDVKEDVKPANPAQPKISGKPQLCTECGKTFENERLLSYHQNWHKGLQPYVCEEPDCVYRSHSKIGLQKHNIQMHREKTRSRRCPKCHHEGGPNHDKLHHDPSLPYGCDEAGCEYRSAEPNEIKRHWEMKHNPENQKDTKTQCPFCVIQIVRSGLQRHLDRHHSPNLPFECSQCGFRGISKQSIKSHEGKYHSKKERIPCSFLCGQTFTQRFSMRRHTLRECPNSTTRDEIREAEKLSGKANERLQKNRQKAQEYMERASKFIKMSSTF